MKKSKFAGVLKAREKVSEPEPAQMPAKPEAAKPNERPKRFHTTLYLDREFYGKIKITLIQEGEDRDFNRLVNDLLREWYAEHGED